MEIEAEVEKILTHKGNGAPESIKFKKHPDGFEIEIYSMYDPPPVDFGMMKALSEFFGTEKIDLDSMCIDKGGCETCDHGSQYGHTIQILGATKNVPAMTKE